MIPLGTRLSGWATPASVMGDPLPDGAAAYREHGPSALRIAYRYDTLHRRYELANHPQSNAEAATTIIFGDYRANERSPL